MQTVTTRHEDFVDDFFSPVGREILTIQEDTSRTCHLCGKPSLPSEQGIHPECARKENLNGE
jgi:hypothetical protein